jgi:alkylation response protein AidB-like acyl-CoA dehydrogenase
VDGAVSTRPLFEAEHEDFRAVFARFTAREIVPRHAEWEQAGRVDRSLFRAAGELGFLGMAVPPEYGGAGQDDFRFAAVMLEELQRAGVIGSGMCMTLHNNIVLPYFLSLADERQRARWLPGMVTGELMGAISMSEPGAGSDLAAIATTARRDGDDYVISGAKTFVTNGMSADLVILAARTGPGLRQRGLSLIVAETGTPGFERGRHLDKIGLRSQDTAELFFDGARVPVANRLGGEGEGFAELMGHLPQERLEIAVSAVAGARAALDWTVAYARDRQVFGGPLLSFQHTRFVLAELVTAVDVAQVYVDHLVARHVRGELDGTDAAKGKLWAAELQQRVVSQCLQLHGGYGFMREYPIARAFLDARVQTIYGGTSEIMKEIIARSLDPAGRAGGSR